MQKQIIDTITTVFSSVDNRDWQAIQKVMAKKVLLDYTSLNGGEPQEQSPEEITNAWAALLPGFDKTHHQVYGFDVTTNDDTVIVHYHGKGEHFLDEQVWVAEGSFDTELERKESKWLITKHKFNVEKQTGNTDLPKKAKQIVKAKKTVPLKEEVSFKSDGLVLAGILYKPCDFDESKTYPAILVGGSWTTVKEQMSGLYAEKFARQGFITVAIDPRYFGESEGKPRFYENPADKISDFKNAVDFLETIDGIDKENIFFVAVCASAGYMASVIAKDERIKSFATVAAWLHDEETVKPLYGGDAAVKTKIKQAKEAKKRFAETGEVDYVPTVSKTDKSAAMPGDFPYYLDPKRGDIPEWSADKFAVMSWEDWLTFNALPIAKKINIPTLMIHSDDAALPDNAKNFFKDITAENKILFWTEGTQFDFYDQPKQVAEAVAAISVFFKSQCH